MTAGVDADDPDVVAAVAAAQPAPLLVGLGSLAGDAAAADEELPSP